VKANQSAQHGGRQCCSNPHAAVSLNVVQFAFDPAEKLFYAERDV